PTHTPPHPPPPPPPAPPPPPPPPPPPGGGGGGGGGGGETLRPGAAIATLDVTPSNITLTGKFDVAQLIVTATTQSGERIDVTRMATIRPSVPIVSVSPTGLVRAVADGNSELVVTLNGSAGASPSLSAHVPTT